LSVFLAGVWLFTLVLPAVSAPEPLPATPAVAVRKQFGADPGVIQELLNTLYSKARQALPNIATGLLVLLLFWIASRFFQRLMSKAIERAQPGQRSVLNLIRQTVKVALMTLGIVTGLKTIGMDISAIVAGLGLTGFALGFALRDALSNLLAGVMILLYRPFRIGDFISVTGFDGTVIDIDLRYTTLTHKDKKFLLPNSMLFTNAIILTQLPVEKDTVL